MNSRSHGWILAVEDSETDLYLLERVLEQAPDAPRIRRARDGEQAIEVLCELAQAGRDSLPDLVVIDLTLPRIDGYEVLTHLRAQAIFHEVPVVVATSSLAEADRKRAFAGGADAYFVKPIDIASYGRLPSVIDEARRARSERLAVPPGAG